MVLIGIEEEVQIKIREHIKLFPIIYKDMTQFVSIACWEKIKSDMEELKEINKK